MFNERYFLEIKKKKSSFFFYFFDLYLINRIILFKSRLDFGEKQKRIKVVPKKRGEMFRNVCNRQHSLLKLKRSNDEARGTFASEMRVLISFNYYIMLTCRIIEKRGGAANGADFPSWFFSSLLAFFSQGEKKPPLDSEDSLDVPFLFTAGTKHRRHKLKSNENEHCQPADLSF